MTSTEVTRERPVQVNTWSSQKNILMRTHTHTQSAPYQTSTTSKNIVHC